MQSHRQNPRGRLAKNPPTIEVLPDDNRYLEPFSKLRLCAFEKGSICRRNWDSIVPALLPGKNETAF
jgi:hypothetical protein